jgi:DNA-binding NarL/FixJ family response regulator
VPGETVGIQQILIVDDDIDFREGLQLVLSDFCDSVLTADNGPRAADLAASLAPDVVLIDPEAGGLETARRLKSCSPQTRIILLSVFDRYLSAALDVGADGYLLKGCPTEELMAAIRRPASRSEHTKLGKEG